jgi:hypothetical protein
MKVTAPGVIGATGLAAVLASAGGAMVLLAP